MSQERRPWIATGTGRKVEPLHPSADWLDLADIARGLSQICRWSGLTKRYYSVAEHCVHMAAMVLSESERGLRVEPLAYQEAAWCLLHDAAEAYLGDFASPVKPHIRLADGRSLKGLEVEYEVCLADQFGLCAEPPSIVKSLDVDIMVAEWHALIDQRAESHCWLSDATPVWQWSLQCWQPREAEARYLTLADRLQL